MNYASLNGFSLNATRPSPVVTTAVALVAYAQIAATGRVISRSVVDAQAQANLAVLGRMLSRAPVVAAPGAQVDLTVRAIVRAAVSLSCQALISTTKPASRMLVNVAASALISVVPRVMRRSALEADLAAVMAIAARARVSIPVSAEADAQILVVPRVVMRSALGVSAVAEIQVNPDVFKRVRFDYPAVPEQTFVVAFEDNVFYVR